MSVVQSEHKFVGNLVNQGHILAVIWIIILHLIVEVMLDKCVELFSPLTSIRPAVEEAEEHQLRNKAFPLAEWLRLVVGIVVSFLFKEHGVKQQLST